MALARYEFPHVRFRVKDLLHLSPASQEVVDGENGQMDFPMPYLENLPLLLFSQTMFSDHRLLSYDFENHRLDEDEEKLKVVILVMISWPSGVLVSNAERQSLMRGPKA